MTRRNVIRLLAALTLAATLGAGNANAAPYTAFFFFGDSLQNGVGCRHLLHHA
jgi:phospholipase/lecithinase/hemolysin